MLNPSVQSDKKLQGPGPGVLSSLFLMLLPSSLYEIMISLIKIWFVFHDHHFNFFLFLRMFLCDPE